MPLEGVKAWKIFIHANAGRIQQRKGESDMTIKKSFTALTLNPWACFNYLHYYYYYYYNNNNNKCGCWPCYNTHQQRPTEGRQQVRHLTRTLVFFMFPVRTINIVLNIEESRACGSPLNVPPQLPPPFHMNVSRDSKRHVIISGLSRSYCTKTLDVLRNVIPSQHELKQVGNQSYRQTDRQWNQKRIGP